MVVWVQAVCSSAARIASPASARACAEQLLGRLVGLGAHLLGLGEHGVRVGVGVLAEGLGLLGGVGPHGGGVLVGGDPQLLGRTDRLELLVPDGDGRRR